MDKFNFKFNQSRKNPVKSAGNFTYFKKTSTKMDFDLLSFSLILNTYTLRSIIFTLIIF